MAYESKTGINSIFRETFNNAISVNENGGTITDVSFDEGIATFNGSSSFIEYGYFYSKDITYKFKIIPNDIVNIQYIAYDGDGGGERNILLYTSGGKLACGYGNNGGLIGPTMEIGKEYSGYVVYNSLNNSLKFWVNGIYYGVDTTATYQPLHRNMTFGSNMNVSYRFNGKLCFFDVFGETRTDTMVENDYNLLTYKDISKEGLTVDISSYSGSITDKMGGTITQSNVEVKYDINRKIIDFNEELVSSVISDGFGNPKDFSICMRARLSVPQSYNGVIMDVGSYGYSVDRGVLFLYSNTSINITIGKNTWYIYVSASGLINKRVHYVFEVDVTNSDLRIFANGVQLTGSAVGTPQDVVYGSTNLTLGKRSDNTLYRLRGQMGDVRCYNRILSLEEKTQLYTNQRNNYD